MEPIKPVEPGTTPTLLEAEFANKLIAAVNALIMQKVAPDGMGKVVMGDDGIVIDLTAVMDRIQQVNDRMDRASATAACGFGGAVTVTVTI